MYVVPELLKEIRENKKLTQAYVAAELGIIQQHYSKFETGEISVPLKHLVPLADMFGVSVDYLLGRTRNESGVNILVEHFTDNCTTGELLERAFALDMDARAKLLEYIDFQTNE